MVTVTETGLGYLIDKVNAINKRAHKYGMGGLKTESVETDPLETEDGTFVLQYNVEITGAVPMLGNYVLVAVKEILQGVKDNVLERATLIRKVPESCLPFLLELPDWARSLDMTCQHCNTKRNRNEVFILYDVDTQKFIQVGRTCLKDFLGVDVTQWLAHAEWLLEIQELYSMAAIYSRGDSVTASKYIPFDKLFAYVWANICRYGFVSKQRSNNEGIDSTIYRALQHYREDKSPRIRSSEREKAVTEEEATESAMIIKWFTDEVLPNEKAHTFGSEDMWFNLKGIITTNLISLNAPGLAVIPAIVWLRHQADKKREEERSVSNWVGRIGDKVSAKVKVVHMMPIDGVYGVSTLHKFVAVDGTVFSWFQSPGGTCKFQVGKEVTIQGTVKNHNEYRGQKETVLKGVKQIVS